MKRPFENFDRMVFDIIDVHVQREFGRMLFVKNNYDVEMYMRQEAMAMVAELRAYLMVRRRESQEERRVFYTVPSTWFQLFKQDHFPRWLLKKFPVREKMKHRQVPQTIVYNMCPHANIKWDKHRGSHITFMETGEYYPDRASNSRTAVP